MIKYIFLFLLIIATSHANSIEKADLNSTTSDDTLVINGENKALDLSDLNLPQYQYDDLSFFTKHFEPEKELLGLLDNPDVLMELDNKKLALEFE
jgi:hypothetical protein